MSSVNAVKVAGGLAVAAIAYKLLSAERQPNSESPKKSQADQTWIKIDGNATRKTMLQELKQEVEKLQKNHGVTPGLAVLIVGDRPDSKLYVKMKKKAATEIGFHSVDVCMPDSASQEEIIAQVKALNADPKVHGILVQLPLPKGVDQHAVLNSISVEKDADGFHPMNVGNMWISGGEPPMAVACTPAGCLELLQRYNIQVSGKRCVVLGRSNIVGMPMVCLLQSLNGTVTCCHSRTKNIPEIVREADIVVVAIGQKEIVRGDWIKPGAVVIDVGIHQVEDKTKKSGFRFVGDVCFSEVAPKCSAITPVPGGVGPMTITMLMKNTVNLARRSVGLERIVLRRNPSSVNISTGTSAPYAPSTSA